MVLTDKQLYKMLCKRRMYKELLPYLILYGYNISDRAWRRFVRNYNKDFQNKETYIASNNKGYILTTKKEEIKNSAIKNLKLGISLIKNAKADLKELSDKDQLGLSEDEINIYDIIMKSEI